IAGFTHKNWAPPPDRIRQATATLIPRGPDQQGVFQSNLFSMGAARLKIIDLDSGNQPILSQDEDFGIAFNGEIYNYVEIRTELEKLGHRVESHSDTETVLRAFMQWEKGCLTKLRGMFAVAWWNKSARRLVPPCDREHSAQLRQASLLPLHERAENGFRIGMRFDSMPEFFELRPYFDVVVNLSIESDSEILVLGKNRLVPGIQVDDFQARRAHREEVGLKNALLVRPPGDQRCG